MTTPLHWTIGRHEIAAFSNVSPIKETANEDCAAVIDLRENETLLVVADGVGGMPDGNVASRIVVEEIAARSRTASEQGQSIREAVLEAIDAANERILREAEGSATTVAIAHIVGDTVRTFHVGDSEIVVFASTDGLRWKTLAHSPVGYAVEAGLLDPRQALMNEARHLVSNVLGSAVLSVEVSSPIPLHPDDRVVIASDGLFDNLHLEEIHSILVGPSVAEAALNLVNHVRQRMNDPSTLPCKPDDLTFLLLRQGERGQGTARTDRTVVAAPGPNPEHAPPE